MYVCPVQNVGVYPAQTEGVSLAQDVTVYPTQCNVSYSYRIHSLYYR